MDKYEIKSELIKCVQLIFQDIESEYNSVEEFELFVRNSYNIGFEHKFEFSSINYPLYFTFNKTEQNFIIKIEYSENIVFTFLIEHYNLIAFIASEDIMYFNFCIDFIKDLFDIKGDNNNCMLAIIDFLKPLKIKKNLLSF